MDGGHYLPEEWPGLGLTQSSLRPENKIDINVMCCQRTFCQMEIGFDGFSKVKTTLSLTPYESLSYLLLPKCEVLISTVPKNSP